MNPLLKFKFSKIPKIKDSGIDSLVKLRLNQKFKIINKKQIVPFIKSKN
jgi:hypothetical protein